MLYVKHFFTVGNTRFIIDGVKSSTTGNVIFNSAGAITCGSSST
uniref:Pectate lyase n=1 Tax=Peronospora matthiolae TaxID=2874970 RepID=A0AAV1VDC6_9STRA